MSHPHLIIDPLDIYYLTGVRPCDPGEILIRIQSTGEMPIGMSSNKIQNVDAINMTIFCDKRTSGIFRKYKIQSTKYKIADFTIIDNRDEWKNGFQQYPTYCVDPDVLTQTLREKIESFGVTLQMQKSPIRDMRMIKTPEEIELLKESQRLNKKVYEQIQSYLKVGVSEEEIARRILILQLEVGFSGPSFSPIVAFGENSSIPHHHPTDRKLTSGEWVLIDMGGVYRGYCSDMTRCLCLKKKEEIKKKRGGFIKLKNEEIYNLLQDIVDTIIPLVKPGVKVSDLDKKAREMLGKYGEYFTHSLGHGVGIDIHEKPFLSSKSEEILRAGMVVTIEPGVYFPQGVPQMNNEECINGGNGLNLPLKNSIRILEGVGGDTKKGDKNSKLETSNLVFGARFEEMCVVTEEGGERV